MENWVLLGASRGLGRAFIEKVRKENSSIQLSVFSRKKSDLPQDVQFIASDFSKKDQWEQLILEIRKINPQKIFYFAGGGPFGKTQDKKWSDHQWAFSVTFEFPAFLVHQFLQNSQSLQQLVVIGSAIAESQPDANASSYCAAKHALKGFVTSIFSEQKPPFDLRLFSPGYIDTNLLPAHAWPRQQTGLVFKPEEVADILWSTVHNAGDVNTHFVLKSPL